MYALLPQLNFLLFEELCCQRAADTQNVGPSVFNFRLVMICSYLLPTILYLGHCSTSFLHLLSINQSEDPQVFAKRVGVAHSQRRQFESHIRYSLYVDSMPIDEMQPLDR
jgi:hypothetical protein